MRFTRRRLLASVVFVVSAVAFLYFVLPKLLGLQRDLEPDPAGQRLVARRWRRARDLLVPRATSRCSAPCSCAGQSRIGWRESYQITMAGLAATRLFAAGGAGGIALTAWALRRSGMGARAVACRMIAFLALLYGVYMATLVIAGWGCTWLVPRVGAVRDHDRPGDLRRRGDRGVPRGVVAPGRLRTPRRPVDERCTDGSDRLARRLATAPATPATGVRTALALGPLDAIRTCSARSGGGASTSPCSGPASTLSAMPRPRR